MTSPRSNVSAVVVRDRLYAVGGFSGKTFLNTIEYLDPETNEWTTFVPQQEIDLTNIAESLKEAVENGLHAGKPVSPIPPSVVEALQNGVNGHHSQDEMEEGAEEDSKQVTVINVCDVLYATSNGKLDEENGHPRVAADIEADADELVVNGSS